MLLGKAGEKEQTAMRLDLGSVPGTPRLLQDYVHNFPRLAPFFTADPQSTQAYEQQAHTLDRRAGTREELCDHLAARNAAWGAPPLVQERILELAQPRALAVVTGQQTGLFGGPLFTLYKALTCVQLAAQLRLALGRPVVPIFWMASEDHDVAEADHVQLLDAAGNLVSLRHTAWGSPGFMPANLVLGPAIQETLQRVSDLLPATSFAPELRAALHRTFAPERTLAEAFARWMVFLLGESGLILVDAADPQLKRLGAPVLQREVEEAPRSSREILAQSEALRVLGYAAQIEARTDGVNCFLLQDGRRSLMRETAGYRLRDSGELLPPARLEAVARQRPESLSPNVALRPILQDYLFPTLAYIAGPGELAYFAQLRRVYQAFDVPMPLVVPRAFLTLADRRSLQLLERYHLSLADLTREPEQVITRVLRAQLPPGLESTLGKAREGVDAIFREVAEAIAAVDPTLRATVGQSAGHIKGHLDQLERKAVQALKRREAETRQQIQRVRQYLMPGGKPQERVFPLLPFLARYGPGLLESLRAGIAGPGWQHGVLMLGG